MRRPLIYVGLSYVIGILLGSCLAIPLEILLACGLALTMAALAISRWRPGLILPICVVAGWSAEAFHTSVVSPIDLRIILGTEPEIVTCHGKLQETPSYRVFVQDQKESWRTLCNIEITELRKNRRAWEHAKGCIAVSTPALLTNYFAGQIVEITGVAHLPRPAPAQGLFDYRAYLRHMDIYYQLDAGSEQDWQVLSSPSKPPLADQFRNWARRSLAAGLPVEDETLHLEWALALGWKTALTEGVSEPFVRAATYHIFAVDGLRMAIIFGILFSLLRALSVSRAVCGLLLIPIIWFYTGLTGWPASAVRASVMLTLVIVGWILKRPTDLINSLFAAALIILLWQPGQLFQAGFQLSFLVVLCMVLALPVLKTAWDRPWQTDPLLPKFLQPRWRTVLAVPARLTSDVFLTSLAAWLGSIPLVAYYFHIVTPVSTLANVFAVPLCGLVLISNFASLLLMAWFPGAGILFNHTGWFFMECIRVLSYRFAGWPGAAFYVPEPSLFLIIVYYAILLAGLSGLLFKSRARVLLLAASTAAVMLCAGQLWSYANATRLHILPANGGMAIYVDAPGTKNDLLVDCGTSNSVSTLVKPFLRAQGVNHLSDLVLTHGDVHHMGGAKLIAELFRLERVWVSPIRFRSSAYRRVIEHFNEHPGTLRHISRNEKLGQWTVLHPEAADRFPQADDNALVFFGTIEGTRVLLVSDLGQQGQRSLLERSPELRADIVITGLPTRFEACGAAFLETVNPRLLIVVDSEFPVSERANPKFMARLRRSGPPVLYTRTTGALRIEWRHGKWWLESASGMKLSSDTLPAQSTAKYIRDEPENE